MTFRPLNDRVVVLRKDVVTKTASGLHLPENSQEKPTQGTVISTGPGSYVDGAYVPTDVTVGDEIIFGGYGHTEITLNDGKKYVVLKAADIIGVLS